MKPNKTRDCRHCNGTGRELDLSAFGERLREARGRKGLSLRAAGAKIGASAPYLCDIEAGRRGIWGPKGYAYLKLLGVSL